MDKRIFSKKRIRRDRMDPQGLLPGEVRKLLRRLRFSSLISYDVKQLEPKLRVPSVGRGPVRKWRLIWAAVLPVNTLFCAFCSFRCEPCNRRFYSAKNTMDRHAARGVRAIRWNRSSGSVRRPKPLQEAAAYTAAIFPVNTLFCAFCSFRFEPSAA